jgi:hypothetical protein
MIKYYYYDSCAYSDSSSSFYYCNCNLYNAQVVRLMVAVGMCVHLFRF